MLGFWKPTGLVVAAALVWAGCGDDDGGGPDDVSADGGGVAGMDSGTAETDAGDETEDGGEDVSDTGPADGGSGFPRALETATADVAGDICGALFRCCDDASLDWYFAPFRQDGNDSWHLAEFRDRLPPDAADFDEESCTSVMTDILEEEILGDYVREVREERIGFDGDAFASCRTELQEAACGEETRAALFDPECFGLRGPTGSSLERKSFPRIAEVGDDCVPIDDGSHGRFRGSCDPDTQFCCYPINPDVSREEDPLTDCGFPLDGEGRPRTGTCQPVAEDDATCNEFLLPRGLKLCQNGASCTALAGFGFSFRCYREPGTLLEVGETCSGPVGDLDEDVRTGECPEDAYCDRWGDDATNECTARFENEVACESSTECVSGFCASDGSTCEANPICAGR